MVIPGLLGKLPAVEPEPEPSEAMCASLPSLYGINLNHPAILDVLAISDKLNDMLPWHSLARARA